MNDQLYTKPFNRFYHSIEQWDEVRKKIISEHLKAIYYRDYIFGYVETNDLLLLKLTPKVALELKESLEAQAHPLLPNSAWISYRILTHEDVPHAIWLTHIAYLLHRVRIQRLSWGVPNIAAQLATLKLEPRLYRALINTKAGWFNPR